MSHLRHPVVITSLEEDFRKIGLLKEDTRHDENFERDLEESYVGKRGLPQSQGGPVGTGSPGKNTHPEGSPEALKRGYKVGGDRLNRQSGSRKGGAIDYGHESDETDEDEDGLAEAYAFAEEFSEQWEAMGEEAEFEMDDESMSELEDFAEEIVELPGEFLGEDDDDPDEDDDDPDEDDEVDEGKMPAAFMKHMKNKRGKKKEMKGGAYEAISDAMARIDAIVENVSDRPSIDEAVPAFANVALIAEMLATFFDSDEELAEAHSTFAEMATVAAEIVQFLQTEDEDEVNLSAVDETLKEYVEVLLHGLEAYSELNEDDDSDDDDSDDDDIDEDGDEGND